MSFSQRKPQNHKNLNLIYKSQFISPKDKVEIIKYLETLYPIWEQRFSESNPPPAGEANRSLLRPVYWLGNWQFACLDYYHPPKGINNRCVLAESYPPVIEKIVKQIESLTHQSFSEKDIPKDWHLNTCLINFYGHHLQLNDSGILKKVDAARVGEHKDFEPGPVGSISFGEKALIQFVKSQNKSQKSEVVLQQWLEDSSLQIFGGDKFKKQLFHRIQRVEDNGFIFKTMNTPQFETRRINFTFRYVPREHIKEFSDYPMHLQNDIKNYVAQLGLKSSFWKEQL